MAFNFMLPMMNRVTRLLANQEVRQFRFNWDGIVDQSTELEIFTEASKRVRI